MCDTCPCFKPSANFPVISPLNSGVCESKITVAADFSPITAGLMTATANLEGDNVSTLRFQTSFIQDCKTMQSSVYNAKKNALATLYGAAMIVDSTINTVDFEKTISGARCWILTQSAYEGPCASYIMFTASSVASYMGAVAENPTLIDQLTELINKTLVSILTVSNCCGMTPLKVTAPTLLEE